MKDSKIEIKFNKKMKALYNHAIVFGKSNINEYRYIDFKQPLFNVPILKLQMFITMIINDELKENEKILNTNFKIESNNVIFYI